MKLKIVVVFMVMTSISFGQSADEIVKTSDDKLRGTSSYTELTIDIIRPKWSKEMKMKGWTRGSDHSVSVITSPAKEKGTVFLMREKEVWNYLLTLERTIKFPPSMMLQNWMGTDLTNDDLIKQSSLVTDYTKKIIGEEVKEGYPSWKIELTPKPNAAVVWGKIIIWIDKKEYMQMQTDYYDEDLFLVNQMVGSQVKTFDGKLLPSKLTVKPVDKPGQSTVITYNQWKFDMDIPDEYFTTNYMKRIH
ncbi:outer membrane lipoprotein-sorting protein [Muricauda sp. SCSIO 64092]|uniref:outer membrane lipoprotein-sorting protein n=1 Tax=Allomuricauda sp. SCSIO 64092 TaxID=2908842 RepID=UPI001FF17A10|nr:outer membrane lipoprotein-sorting protein [Muricauda sp. SCSIO 64092]UOY05493.1 outer membrane lipoprotein-sorting protein [Muricauda sp. SCSIO 64092]